MARVLVTGGCGFIGSHTVDKLVEKGYDVRVLDNLEYQVHRGRIPNYFNPKAEYMIGSVRSASILKKALEDVDYVIHLAGMVGMIQAFWQAKKYMDVNAGGTGMLFETILKTQKFRGQIKKVVVASSKSLYGESAYVCKEHGMVFPNQRPIEQLEKKEWEVRCPSCSKEVSPVGIPEEKPPQNLTPYTLSKYTTERLAMSYSYALNIPIVAFRYFNVYGPRQSLSNPYTGVIAVFMSRYKNGNPPLIVEDGKEQRDFIYVADVAWANVEALEKGSGVYNLGTGKPHSVNEIAKSIGKALGSSVEPKVTEEFRPGDSRHDLADISRFTRDFGKHNFVDLDEGLRKLVEWGRNAEAIDLYDTSEMERKRYFGRHQ